MASPSPDQAAAEIGLEVAEQLVAPPPVTANSRAFMVMMRNAAFRRVELAARRDAAGLAEAELPGGFVATAWTKAIQQYFEVHASIQIGQGARAASWFQLREVADGWEIRQVLDDPQGWHDWAIVAEVDKAASDELGAPAWKTLRFEQG